MAIHLRKQITSEDLDLPELREFIGKEVVITITEIVPRDEEHRWDALAAIGGTDLIDADVVRRYRMVPPPESAAGESET